MRRKQFSKRNRFRHHTPDHCSKNKTGYGYQIQSLLGQADARPTEQQNAEWKEMVRILSQDHHPHIALIKTLGDPEQGPDVKARAIVILLHWHLPSLSLFPWKVGHHEHYLDTQDWISSAHDHLSPKLKRFLAEVLLINIAACDDTNTADNYIRFLQKINEWFTCDMALANRITSTIDNHSESG